jgi:hypothetical protein
VVISGMGVRGTGLSDMPDYGATLG